jgi:protein phosphatase
MSRKTGYRVEIHSCTDTGHARERNEDTFGEFAHPSGRVLLVVADGMGGHRGGSTASRMAVDEIGACFESAEASSGDNQRLLTLAVNRATAAIHERSRNNVELARMGTTATVLLFDPRGESGVAHVGDSRAYRLRANELTALTTDHSLVALLVREGQLTQEEARVHPRRNEILRSIGIEPRVEVDYNPLDVAPGDRFLLCSDGLHGVVPEAEIAARLALPNGRDAAQALVAQAHHYGSPDNVTVMLAQVRAG